MAILAATIDGTLDSYCFTVNLDICIVDPSQLVSTFLGLIHITA